MRRRTFDALVSATGLLLAAVLIVAGALLTWGHVFVDNEVHNQLAAQKIVFPTTSNAEFKALPKTDQAAMAPYAGQLMTDGAQAEAYADHFIAVHLGKIGGGKTYSQLSAQAQAQPSNAALTSQVSEMFKGTTLRSMLLSAYGFWTMGQIALAAAIAAYVAAALMLILSLLGFAHLRRTGPDREVLTTVARHSPVSAA